MDKEYDTYVKSLQVISERKWVELIVRDFTPGRYKCENKRVVGVISHWPERPPKADKLWIRFELGHLHPEPWAIKVIAAME